MSKCLNCDTELIQTEGKREKMFCNSTCRSNYWQKQKVLSRKSELKIEKWEVSEKPNPLTLHELVYANGAKKGQLVEKSLIDLAKNATKETPKDSEYKNYTAKVSDVVIVDLEKTQRIDKIEKLLAMPEKYVDALKRKRLEKELDELRYGTNKFQS